MQFLKTLFWVMLAVAAVIFSLRNWVVVQLNLWSGLVIDAKLPVLLFIAFLIGFLPTWAILQAGRWRLKRRLDSAERALADIRAADPVPVPAETSPAPPPTLVPPVVS